MHPSLFRRAPRVVASVLVATTAISTSACASLRGGSQSLLDLTSHLESIGRLQESHREQHRTFTEQLPNQYRVAGAKRAALVMTVDGDFVALAWYENGKGPVCKMESIGVRSPFPITCTNDAGELIYDSRASRLPR